MKKIEQKVIKFIDEKGLIKENDRILIALSGGPDSVFLLYFLHKFKRRFKIDLGVLHINHKLRGKAASDDEDFCRSFSKKLNVNYFSLNKNVKAFSAKNKISIEEAGREIRYNELKKFHQKYNYTKIATAHNCSDNSETIFLNLIKGTGIKGISGIPVKRGNIIRPMLNLTKDEILFYLKHHKINYRIDLTNTSSDYERNYLRNEIFPLIKKKLNPSLDEALFNSSEIFKNYLSLINKLTDEKISSIAEFKDGTLILPVEKIKQIHSELLGDFFKNAIERNFFKQITFNDFNHLKSLIDKQAGSSINLSNNLKGFKERKDLLIFKDGTEDEFIPVEIKENNIIKIESKKFSIRKISKDKINFTADLSKEYINADGIENLFLLRKWKSGDKFFPLGLKGSKKVSDFLNEQKLPSLRKAKQLVLTNRGKIVWVLGLRIDERFKVTVSSEKVFELCLK